ncbi:Phospholipase D1 [Saccharomyces pastorianus]|uniref:Phospholipase n=1 Tax=Saccharomyces pastorianus TaxID=27292 RepID=A0A6C1ECX3_SACPS|nr:Phospholipase D1 [Saccharomyces pastorianus]
MSRVSTACGTHMAQADGSIVEEADGLHTVPDELDEQEVLQQLPENGNTSSSLQREKRRTPNDKETERKHALPKSFVDKNMSDVSPNHSLDHLMLSSDRNPRRGSAEEGPSRPHNHLHSSNNNIHSKRNSKREESKSPSRHPSPAAYTQQQFNGWKKEFGQAFKKISAIGRLRSSVNPATPTGSGHRHNQHQQVNDEDLYTQRLASDLLDSLLSGCPASLFASTQFLRDEHGKRRAPMLLAKLDVRVSPLKSENNFLDLTNGNHHHHHNNNNNNSSNNITPNTNSDRRPSLPRRSSIMSISSNVAEYMYGRNENSLFRIHLEYGIDDNRLKWSIVRSYKDIKSLHHKLKIVAFQQSTISKLYSDNNRYHSLQLPHFPHYKEMIKERNMLEKKLNNKPTSSAAASHISAGNENNNNHDVASLETLSSSEISEFDINNVKMKHLQDLIDEPDDFSQPIHLRLERYLRLLNIALCLRPHANRLFEFYELSPLGNLLSRESGFQGKQGYLVIRSTAKAQGWRVSHFGKHAFKDMIDRHTTKWFMVRNSYVTYVSDLSSTTPLDVFLIDWKFKVRFSGNKNNILDNKKEINWIIHDPNLEINDELEELAIENHTNDIINRNGDSKTQQKKSNISSKLLLLTLENSERKLKIICKSENSLKQWISSIIKMSTSTIWSKPNRFGSFAPVRTNSFCKFLVDGRDYFWSLSEALLMAKDVIYIHDWWLSPELYLRRPVKGNQEFRIDRMLKKCAEKGIKIFIVIYRNVGNIVGTDSLWTKHSMLSLHPNIHIIRSPNQWLQNTYFWAHHEKFVVIDETFAFIGGTDLCYGRYDTFEHVLRDDAESLLDQNFPGKDYSNARIADFHDLDKPFESMYDRKVIPRMPWHDVQMMTLGEPARDLARHFVQRWNYLLRAKRPSRLTPLLTPPSDLTAEELNRLPMFEILREKSTCETQILRSAGNWSLGLKETECSIQNAYLKLIEKSEHFIYIENQFFITSTAWNGTYVLNKIGDALVDRIIKANQDNKPWKAFVLIPLMPGFDSPVDAAEASSLRLIMQFQYQSISRGEHSVFQKLKKLNIDPAQYIQFFSLRKWSTFEPNEKLITEQLYVHAKIMIADDRRCIIGSANINERSQLGNRDSEVAILVRDTDLVKTKMNGDEYYAGRFPWELRQRLMREHLGCDVDLVEFVEQKFERFENVATKNYKTLHTLDNDGDGSNKWTEQQMIDSAMIELGYREIFDCKCSSQWHNIHGNVANANTTKYGINEEEPKRAGEDAYNKLFTSVDHQQSFRKRKPLPKHRFASLGLTFNHRAGVENIGIRDHKVLSTDPRLRKNDEHKKEVDGYGPDGWKKESNEKYKSDATEQLKEWALKSLTSKVLDDKNLIKSKASEGFSEYLPDEKDLEMYIMDKSVTNRNKWGMLKRICYLQYLSHKLDDRKSQRLKKIKDMKRHLSSSTESTKNASNSPPLNEKSNEGESTDVNQDGDGDEYHRLHADILRNQELDDNSLDDLLSQIIPKITNFNSGEIDDAKKEELLKLNFIDPYSFEDPLISSFSEGLWFTVALRNTLLYKLVFHCQPDNAVQNWKEYGEFTELEQEFHINQEKLIDLEAENINSTATNVVDKEREKERMKRAAELRMKLSGSLLYGFNQKIFDKHTAQRILERIHGHLVIFPTEWLAKEVESRNWIFNSDRLSPMEIYN